MTRRPLPALVASLSVIAASPAAAQPGANDPGALHIKASAAQMLGLGGRAEQRGSKAEAETIYRALFADPDPQIRGEARYRVAALLAERGRMSDAAVELRRILDEQPRAGAVRVSLAHLLQRMGDDGAARRELRAARAGGLAPQLERIVDRYQSALAATKPLGASLSLVLAPDSNINRATSADTLSTVLGEFTLDETSAPRSGTGLALRGGANARLALGSSARLVARLGANADLYRHSQFNDVAGEIAIGGELFLARRLVALELAAGQRRIAGTKILSNRRIGVSLTQPLGDLMQARAAFARSRFDNHVNALQSGTHTLLQLGVERALSSRSGIGASLSGERYSAVDAAYSTLSWRAGLNGWHEFGRATLSAGIESGRLEADQRLALFPERRRDRSIRLSAGLALRRLTLFGFAPSVRVTHERNRSSVAFYDYTRTRTEFVIARAF